MKCFKFEIGKGYIIENNQYVILEGLDALKQKINLRLNLFLGEFFLDVTEGVPYFSDVLTQDGNLQQIELILENEISKEPDVKSVTTTELNFNADENKLTYKALVTTSYGDIDVQN